MQNKQTNTKVKRIPQRTCLGCNQEKPKNELLRVVRGPEGEISLDFTGKKSGRGAYICADLACFKKARKAKRIERSLDCTIPDEVFDALQQQLTEKEDA